MTTTLESDLQNKIAAIRRHAESDLTGKVITVMSSKGGVGKTLLAMELAYVFNAVLVDFDWDSGNATRALGYLHERYQRIPLLDAFASGRTPTPKRLSKRPDLIPGHPDFETNQPSPTLVRDSLTQWALEWSRPVVVDCHPGAGDSEYGAVAAADAIVSPVHLATRELNALEGQLAEFDGYPVILVPNEVPSVPPRDELRRLQRLAEHYNVEVASPLYEHVWYRRRKLRTVLSASASFGKRATPFVEQVISTAQGVLDYAA